MYCVTVDSFTQRLWEKVMRQSSGNLTDKQAGVLPFKIIWSGKNVPDNILSYNMAFATYLSNFNLLSPIWCHGPITHLHILYCMPVWSPIDNQAWQHFFNNNDHFDVKQIFSFHSSKSFTSRCFFTGTIFVSHNKFFAAIASPIFCKSNIATIFCQQTGRIFLLHHTWCFCCC